MSRSCAYVLGMLAACISASAQSILFVASYGSDSNNCSAAAPCRTPAFAVNHASAAATVMAPDSADFGLTTTINILFPMTIDAGLHGAFVSGPDGGPAIQFNTSASVSSFFSKPLIMRKLSITQSMRRHSSAIGGKSSDLAIVLGKISVSASTTSGTMGPA
jgi:hypothetical protein